MWLHLTSQVQQNQLFLEPGGSISPYVKRKPEFHQHEGEERPIFSWVTSLKRNINLPTAGAYEWSPKGCRETLEKEQRGVHTCALGRAHTHVGRNDLQVESGHDGGIMTRSLAWRQNSGFYSREGPDGPQSTLERLGPQVLEQMHCLVRPHRSVI